MKNDNFKIKNNLLFCDFSNGVIYAYNAFSAIRAEADVTKPTSAKFTETGVKQTVILGLICRIIQMNG